MGVILISDLGGNYPGRSLISNNFNIISGLSSLATLQDQWMNSLELNAGREMMLFENFGSMVPALFINYGAIYEKYNNEANQAEKINELSFYD